MRRARLNLVLLSALICINSSVSVSANLGDFTQGLKKKPEPQVQAPAPSRIKQPVSHYNQSSNKPPETYKAHVDKISQTLPLKSAVLWHAPPYRQLATKLSHSEELIRDIQAMDILLRGAENKYPSIERARKLAEKQESVFSLLAKVLITRVDAFSENMDFENLERVKTAEEASAFLSKINEYLYSNFQSYKKSFYINDMRNQRFRDAVHMSRSKLTLIAGDIALNRVDELYLGGGYAN